MAGANWRPLRAVAAKPQREARLNAHYAAQWLARVARAYVAPKPDDSHTNLGWDERLRGFATHPLPDGNGLGLSIGDLTLVVLTWHGDPAMHMMSLNRQTDADVRHWLGLHFGALGFSEQSLDAPSPYEMPAFAVAGGAPYAVDGEALGELASWYANANLVLGEARRELLAHNLDAPPVRCWPHHFDLDTLIYFDKKHPDDVRTMGLGFSPGDEYYDEPYFYVSIYPAPDVAALPKLPAVGHWHSHEFTAAVAPASRIIAAEDQQAETAGFLRAAVEIVIKTSG